MDLLFIFPKDCAIRNPFSWYSVRCGMASLRGMLAGGEMPCYVGVGDGCFRFFVGSIGELRRVSHIRAGALLEMICGGHRGKACGRIRSLSLGLWNGAFAGRWYHCDQKRYAEVFWLG